MACLLSTVQNGGNGVQILGFFGDEFILQEKPTLLEAETFVSG